MRYALIWLLAVAGGTMLPALAAPAAAPTVRRTAASLFKAPATLTVRSPDIAQGQPVDRQFSAYYENRSPEITWGPLPEDTKSLAIIVEDPDAGDRAPIVHWIGWNIPVEAARLPRGVPVLWRPVVGVPMRQGLNSGGTFGYRGPRPPIGSSPHHYHFQLFALDRMVELPRASTRDMLVTVMRGHVLAKGELVATYAQDKPAR